MSPDDATAKQLVKARKQKIVGIVFLTLYVIGPLIYLAYIGRGPFGGGPGLLVALWKLYWGLGLWLGLGVSGVALLTLALRGAHIFALSGIGMVFLVYGAFAGFLVWVSWFDSLKIYYGDARVNLIGIYRSAMALRDETKTFAISNITQLGYAVQGVRGSGSSFHHRYSFWYSVNGVPTAVPLPPGNHYMPGPCDVTTPPTSVKVTASATGFLAAAKGNIDDDATCDEWSINDTTALLVGEKRSPGSMATHVYTCMAASCGSEHTLDDTRY